LSSGRSYVSQRTDDFESGRRTATFPSDFEPESLLLLPPELPLPELESSLPHAPTVTARAPVTAIAAMRHATECTAISSS
jgi:hypothetical protein